MNEERSRVYITFWEKVGPLIQIWVQRDPGKGRYLHSLLTDLKSQLLLGSYIPRALTELKPMVPYLAKYTDSKFYRIFVKCCDPSQANAIQVHFIDYGFNSTCGLGDIRLINPDLHRKLHDIPAQASSFFLNGFLFSEQQRTPVDLDRIMKEVLYKDNVAFFTPVGRCNFIDLDYDGVLLSETLISKGFGTKISPHEVTEVALSCLGNNHLRQPKMVSGASNYEKIGPSCRSLQTGSLHQAIVVHVEDGPNNFTIQLTRDIKEILPRINEMINSSHPTQVSEPLCPGYSCLARSREDKAQLRRAVVTNVKLDSCLLYFIDFGRSEEVPSTEIYTASPNLSTVPVMALRFALANIQGLKNAMTPQMKQKFIKLVLDQEVKVQIEPQERGTLVQYCELFVRDQNVKDILPAEGSQDYRAHVIPQGKEVDVIVSFVDSPSFFYVQYASESATLGMIKEAVNRYCSSQPRITDVDELDLGTPVCALFYQQWYRAKVMDIGSNGVTVFYVDFGNRELVSLASITKISSDLVSAWTMQAAECGLRSHDKTHDLASSEYLQKLILDKYFKMKIIKVHPPSKLIVDLIDENGLNVEEVLKKNLTLSTENNQNIVAYHMRNASDYVGDETKAAVVMDDLSRSFKKDKHDSRPKYDKQDYAREGNRLKPENGYTDRSRWKDEPSQRSDEDCRQRRKVIDRSRGSRNDQPADRKHRWENKNEEWKEKGGHKKWEENGRGRNAYGRYDDSSRIHCSSTSPGTDGDPEDEKAEIDFSSSKPTPSTSSQYGAYRFEANSEYLVVLSHMNSLDHFYVQGANSQEELVRLGKLINSEPKATNIPAASNFPSMGRPVLARYHEDELLYRGIITKIVGSVSVLFVDYGNCAQVDLSDLFHIREDMKKDKIQAVRCSLIDVRQKFNDPSMTAKYKAYFGADPLIMRVEEVRYCDAEMVLDVVLTLPNGHTVSSALVNDGLAAPASYGLLPRSVYVATIPSMFCDSVVVEQDCSKEPNIIVEAPVEVAKAVDSASLLPVEASREWVEPLPLLLGQTVSIDVTLVLDERAFRASLKAVDLSVLCTLAEHERLSISYPTKAIITVLRVLSDRLLVKLYSAEGASLAQESVERISTILPFPVINANMKLSLVHCENGRVFLQDSREYMDDFLNTLFEAHDPLPQEEAPFSQDSVCCAKSSDGNWYRAKVTLKSGNSYTVNFVDYGNSEEVPTSSVKTLRKEFMYIEEKKIEATVGAVWKKTDIMDLLEEFDFFAQLVRVDGTWKVRLESESGVDFVDTLKSLKVADHDPESIFLGANFDPSEVIKKGKSIPVLISHYDSPNDFWVQLQEHVGHVEAVQQSLQESIDTLEEYDGADPVFAAQYSEDGIWYRAALQEGENIRFIDYGNEEKAVVRKKLPVHMQKPFKGYAVPMHLGMRPTKDSWDAAMEIFFSFIETDELTVAVVKDVSYRNIVDIMVKGESLVEKLVSSGEAVEVTDTDEPRPPIASRSVEPPRPPATPKADLPQQPVAPEVEPPQPPVAPKVQPPQPPVTPKAEPQPPVASKAEPPPATAPVETPVPSINVPAPDGSVFISHINTPNDFYLTFNVWEHTMELIGSGLLQYCDRLPHVTSVSINDVVSALFPEDGMWYRAKVLDKEGPEVLFIDYGNSSITPDLKELPPALMALPGMAWHCSLGRDVDPEAFQSLADNGKASFNLEVLDESSSPKIVRLLLNGQDIVEKLKSPKTIEGFISLVVSSDEFYFQYAEDSPTLDQISDGLALADSFPEQTSIACGDIIAVKHSDELWYRAQVLSESPFKVFLMDFGDTTDVSGEYKGLPEDLAAKPSLVSRCSLGVQSPELTDKLMELSNGGSNKLELRIVQEDKDQKIVRVLKDGTDVTPKLASKICRGDPVVISHVNSLDDFYVQVHSKIDEIESLTDNLFRNAGTYPKLPDADLGSLVCALYPEDKHWYRCRVTSHDQVTLIDVGSTTSVSEFLELPEDLKALTPFAIGCKLRRPDDITTWSSEANQKFKEMSIHQEVMTCQVLSEEGEIYTVELLHGKKKVSDILRNRSLSPQEVEYFVTHEDGPENFYVISSESLPTLEKIKLELLEGENFEDVEAQIGDLVAVKDGCWVRGRSLSNGFFLIDDGRVVGPTQSKKLPKDLAEIPPLVLQCTFQPYRWSEKAKEEFKDKASLGLLTGFRLRLLIDGNPKVVDLFYEKKSLFETLVKLSPPPQKISYDNKMIPGSLQALIIEKPQPLKATWEDKVVPGCLQQSLDLPDDVPEYRLCAKDDKIVPGSIASGSVPCDN